MISHPRIKSKYHVEEVAGEGVFLLSENERHVLEGETILKVVPLLDGCRTWDDLRQELSTTTSPPDIDHVFKVLLDNQHLEDANAALPPEVQAYWTELGCSGTQAVELARTTNVELIALGDVEPAVFTASLQSIGFQYDPAKPVSVKVVLTDDYQRPELRDINKTCLEFGLPWILVKPSGLIPMVGPFFLPGRTACWACLASRLKHNREVESYIQRKKNLESPLPTTRMRIPLADAQATSIAVMQLVRWLVTGQNPQLESRVMSIDVMTATQESHFVVRRPQCECCGDPKLGKVGGRPVVLQNQKLKARDGNGLRSESAESTFQRYAHHVSRYTGTVKKIAPSAWHGAGPLKVYVAGHNFALKNDNLYFIKDGLRSHSSGKGRTDAQARASALCEALERYSGVFRGEEERRLASYEQLGDEAVDPTTVTLYSETQYRQRMEWLKRNSRFQVVPLPFDRGSEISWSPVWSMTEQRRKFLPTSQLYYGFEDSPEKFYFWGDSNGNAAGSCFEDATLQGFLELVERDSVALWWYNRIPRPGVDLDSLNDPYIDEMRSFYANHNRRFWVLDLTADLGIPTFASITQRFDGPTEDIVFGFGAHLDARIAISRAITEMNQFIPALLTTDEQGNTRYGFTDNEAVRWWRTGKLDEHPYLKETGVSVRIEDLPATSDPDVKRQIDDCFSRVEDRGMEVLILDQTRPDVGLPVVKVIVPGLRHFWARFAPGRLYDVPVELGWLDKPRSEAELNPIPMFV